MRRINKKRVAIAIIILVVIIVGAIIVVPKLTKPKKNDKPKEEIKIESEIKAYGYSLQDNKTQLYKDYFKELEDTLNEKEKMDEQKYAEIITKLFIADFYDLNSKKTKQDVGGTQFVYSKSIDNFLTNAKDTIYKYVENNLNDDRKQALPSVSSVTIDNVENTTFTYNAESITDEKAYKVKATWEYKEDLGYQKEATITLMHDDKKLVVVEVK